jgi:hypothetical protein
MGAGPYRQPGDAESQPQLEPLRWDGSTMPGILRAGDDIGLYIIEPLPAGQRGVAGTYRVGYFPGPGPEADWASGLASLDDAKRDVEACRRHLTLWRAEIGIVPG